MADENNNKRDNLVEIAKLTFRRGDRLILDNLDLTIPRGKITTIMGPSGTGKTTVLQLIGGALKAEAGRIVVDGEDLDTLGQKALYAVRRKMGMMFQSGALFNDLSVIENVKFPMREHTDLSERMMHDIALMKLHAVGLRGAADLMPSALSGGMARRVALARAIALDPLMIMYDEPFTGQDPITVGVILKLMRMLNDNLGLTSVIVSHDVAEIMSISDYVYLLSEGQVVAEGSPDQLRQTDSAWAQQFLKGLDDGPVPFHYPAAAYGEDLFHGAAK